MSIVTPVDNPTVQTAESTSKMMLSSGKSVVNRMITIAKAATLAVSPTIVKAWRWIDLGNLRLPMFTAVSPRISVQTMKIKTAEERSGSAKKAAGPKAAKPASAAAPKESK